jgi:signal transduction histidine kinase
MNTDTTDLLIGLALGWLSLGVALLMVRIIGRWWRVRRYGQPVDHNALLMSFGRRMSSAPDQKSLVALLVGEIPNAFQAQRAALLLPEEHRLVSPAGNGLSLAVSHAAVRWVAAAGEAQPADRGHLRRLILQGPSGLEWAAVWVPVMRGADLRGMWLLETREKGLRYSPQDLRCLTALGRQAAIMLEAASFAEQERRTAHEMRALYRQVVTAREAERGSIARELHDGVLQDLCAVTRDLKALEAKSDAEKTDLRELTGHSGETVNALRAICNDLRPPLLQHDLTSALRKLVQDLDTRSGAPIHIEVSADDLSVPDDAALAIFRITQEALHNAIQHADASEVAVRLTQYPDRLRLTVTDDGRGIVGGVDPARFVAEGHFGLAGMRERAAMIGAKLDVQTAIDYGTVVVLELSR